MLEMRFEIDDVQALGSTLLALRRNLGLSQADLAQRVKVTTTTVYRHESGRKAPDTDELTRYLRALGCTFAEFQALHETLKRCRERDKSGPLWWKRQSAQSDEASREAREVAAVGEEAAQVARRLVDLVFKKLDRHR